MRTKLITRKSGISLLLTAIFALAMVSHAQNITISSVGELIAFRDAVNDGNSFKDQTVILLDNINLGGDEDNQWVPIGTPWEKFEGTFDGNNKVISRIYINNSKDYQGLFGYNSGTIKNLGVNIYIKGSRHLGGLAGYNNGTIENSYATGNVESGYNYVYGDNGLIYAVDIGGLAGSSSGTIKNSYATGNISGNSNVGGLVGHNYRTIENSHAIGDVTLYSVDRGSGSDGGGLAGGNSGTIKNSYATGDVVGGDYGSNFGGLAGRNSGIIENSYATGNINGPSIAGGLAGDNSAGTIKNSYAIGDVKGYSAMASSVGGLVAYNSNGSIIENSYAIGNVNGNSGFNVGGLAGYSDGTIKNSYTTGDAWIGAISGFRDGTYVCGPVGKAGNRSTIVNSDVKTVEQIKQHGTFVDWDFTDIWIIDANANCGYPFLQTFEGPLLSGGCKTTPIPLLSGECETTPIRQPQLASNNSILAHAIGNTIVLQNLPAGAKVEVFNLNGKRVYSANPGNPKILKIEVQTKGMYIVNVSSGSEKKTVKVAVK